jgi:hypothetical protein
LDAILASQGNCSALLNFNHREHRGHRRFAFYFFLCAPCVPSASVVCLSRMGWIYCL